jgi:hypothetical protein
VDYGVESTANVSVGDTVTWILQTTGGPPPLSKRTVWLATTSGTFAVKACPLAACKYYTDANGMLTITGTAWVSGTVTLSVSMDGLTQQTSFVVSPKVYSMSLLSAPSGSFQAGVAVTPAFAVQVLAADGVTAARGQNVTFSVPNGSVQLAACKVTPCVVVTNASGIASTGAITNAAAGAVTLLAADNGMSQTASFTVLPKPDLMTLVSAPANGSYWGTVAGTAFAVRVTSADGAAVEVGRNVLLTATGGTLGACGASSCTMTTDANGLASSSVTAAAAGTVGLRATEQGAGETAVVTATFTAVAPPDGVTVVGVPGSVFQGATTASPFVVGVRLADGITPAAGVPVVLSLGAGSGSAQFAVCGAAQCSVTTDASGHASSLVTGTQVGAVTLEGTAQLSTGNKMVSAGLTVLANVRSVTAAEPSTYVAAGASVAMDLDAAAVQNGSAAVGQSVLWTGAAGFTVSGGSSTTDAAGHASAQGAVGPIAAGSTATASACVWATVCAPFGATGVGASALQIAIVSGGQQAATGGAALSSVVAQVTDGSGHPVAGATVTVGQTARALDVVCPSQGRCPAAPVLATASSAVVSDLNGDVTVAPLVAPGKATMTAIAFSTGTQGFATVQVSSSP